MFLPITSEITLASGMTVKQLATGKLYLIGEKLKNDPTILGDDPWELIEVAARDNQRLAVGDLELAEKYFAEVENRR